MKFISGSQQNMIVLLLTCFLQQQYCASPFFFAPPQKYSVHLSRKELINELQGLSRKVNGVRSKWSDEAQPISKMSLKDLLSAEEQTNEDLVPSSHSISSVETELQLPVRSPKYQPVATPTHRPSPAEISLGIFNIKNYIQSRKLQEKLRKQSLKAIDPSSAEDLKEMEVVEPAALLSVPEIGQDLVGEERIAAVETKPSAIRSCLFLRSGCVPVRRLDEIKTSAYLDKVKALMTS